jgi:murein DD-endopeptidase MepM/ murein hydrolase activator NlpD
MKRFCLLLLVMWWVNSTFAQTIRYGSLSTKVDSLINAIPTGNGTDEYQVPTSGQLTQWGTVITKILQNDYSGANTDASALGYQIIQFVDTTTTPRVTYYVLEKSTSSTNYWGSYFFNPAPQRPKIAIAAPHEIYDLNTGKQARLIFMKTGARAFFLNGTHRCNSSSFTACSGTTTACSDTSAKYRASDQAHTATGMFQKTTEIMRSNISGLYLIQPHGFSKDSGDPSIIMSNGTRYTPSPDYLIALRDNLLTIDATLTFKIAHVDLTWTKLVATENTQGRLINGSSNPCTYGASSTTGRFLHLEQAYSGLRDSENNRKKLSDAVAKTFPADTLTLTSPNGGESWAGGSSHAITWTKTGFVDYVKLEYSTDNGSRWTTIIASATNSGTYTWSVPSVGTWRARVRISDPANPATTDLSNGRFALVTTVWPISGTTTPDPIASAFGSRLLSGTYDFHRGIDMPNVLNTPVHPVKPGVIVRMEDTSVSGGTALERNGNWILVRTDSVGGQPRHNAYLHLNGFHTYHVGDTVATSDTVGFMGKSGIGINTIHTHLELYKNLSGTSIDKDKAYNVLEILPYTDANSYSVTTIQQGDSTAIQIDMSENELDFDQITLYGTLASRTVSFNLRTGIDPSDNDNPRYNNVFIDPVAFTLDSTTRRLRFWTSNSEIGEIDSARITDIKGYSLVVVDYTGNRYAVTSGNWDDAIWAATPGGAAGSISNPTQYDDVVINDGITVAVTSTTSSCKSVSFAGTTSQLSLAASSRLNVYGNFTIASTTHNAFSSWGSGAKLRFVGSNKQVLSGWSTTSSTDISTTLMEVQVDKSGDTLKTPHTDMKLALGTSFDILNGIFLLDSLDDINGRTFDGSGSATPTINVSAGGAFLMKGGASSIRSGTSGSISIGKMTISGRATVTTNSSLGINFGNIDVENGGTLSLTTGWSANKLNAGIVTVKNGGLISSSTTSNVWSASSSVNLQDGGEYKTTSATTIFPTSFTNLGTVHYARTVSGDQTIVDMNYHRLEISYSGNNKIWTLAAARSISDSLEINNSASLVLTASTAQTLNLLGTLRLTSGSLNNSDANVTFAPADGILISRATGTISAAPAFGAMVDVRYSSTVTSVSTGPELPVSSSVLRDLSLICDTATVTLNAPVTVNRTLTLSNGTLNNSSHALTMADGATIRRATGTISAAPQFAGRVNVAYVSSLASVVTGNELPVSGAFLDTLSLESPMNVTLGADAAVKGNLKFLRGLLFLNDHNITLDTGATTSGVPADTTMVVTNGTGSFNKMYARHGSFTYPVGDTAKGKHYTPFTADFDHGTFPTSSYLGTRIMSTRHPNNIDGTNYIGRYWIVSDSGISGFLCNVKFKYDESDVIGSENEIYLGQWDGVKWTQYNQANAAANELTGAITSFSDFSGISSIQKVSVQEGWNLISVPVVAADMSKSSLFSSATSSAFMYQKGYVPKDTLQNSIGYWLKFSTTEDLILPGTPFLTDTFTVSPGWNIIGSLGTSLPTNHLIPIGTNIQSGFFGYEGVYQVSDTLKPGKGYWIKVSSAGHLILTTKMTKR